MTRSSEDLRRYPRVSVDLQAKVRTADGRQLSARTRDLSRSGMCIITTSGLTPGEQLRVELILLLGPNSSSEPLPLAARVVWCTPISGAFQVGAKFDKLSTKEATFLDMFLRYLDGSLLPAGAEMEVLDEDDSADADEQAPGRTPPPDVKDDPFKS
jgi:hypothetical protein